MSRLQGVKNKIMVRQALLVWLGGVALTIVPQIPGHKHVLTDFSTRPCLPPRLQRWIGIAAGGIYVALFFLHSFFLSPVLPPRLHTLSFERRTKAVVPLVPCNCVECQP